MFKCNKTTSSKKYWVCGEPGCGVYVYTNLKDDYLSITSDHNHVAEPDVLETKELREKMKNRILPQTTPITKIYDEELTEAHLSAEVAAQFPTIHEHRTFLSQKMNDSLHCYLSLTRFEYEQSSTQEDTGDSSILAFSIYHSLINKHYRKSAPC